jgi:phenylpyruvate tautomerase PptA (4-oxalocrotonate tautomerase family)
MIFTGGVVAVRTGGLCRRVVGGWEERTVPIIQCDIRRGRTEAQLRQLASGLTRVVADAVGQPIDSIFLVMREMPGFNFVDAGEHVPEYESGPDGRDLAGEEQLRQREARR